MSKLLLADLGAGKTGKLCCVIALDRAKPKLMCSLSQWDLLAQVNVLASSVGLIRLPARLAFISGTSEPSQNFSMDSRKLVRVERRNVLLRHVMRNGE